MTISAGAMDRRIEFLVSTETRGRGGQPKKSWSVNSALGRVWAYKKSIRSDEQFAGEQMRQVDTTEFTIYWQPNVETHWRVREIGDYRGDASTDYDLLSVIEQGRREFLVLRCVNGMRVR
jgi:SPP1 family predicted phage head-tail adaptor